MEQTATTSKEFKRISYCKAAGNESDKKATKKATLKENQKRDKEDDMQEEGYLTKRSKLCWAILFFGKTDC